jgi:hypothetical protein
MWFGWTPKFIGSNLIRDTSQHYYFHDLKNNHFPTFHLLSNLPFPGGPAGTSLGSMSLSVSLSLPSALKLKGTLLPYALPYIPSRFTRRMSWHGLGTMYFTNPNYPLLIISSSTPPNSLSERTAGIAWVPHLNLVYLHFLISLFSGLTMLNIKPICCQG